jgi:hypothetical protein
MRKAGWTPSIVKDEDDQNVYIVLDDLGRNGRAPTAKRSSSAPTSKQSSWTCSKANTKKPGSGRRFQYRREMAQDVSADVAHEPRRRCDLQLRDVPFYLEEFERYEGRYHDVRLPLPIMI